MSLARALTRRYRPGQEEPAAAPALGRAPTLNKRLDKPIQRSLISLPVELISSTNVLAYEAPDIHTIRDIKPGMVPPVDPLSPLSAPSSVASFKSYDSDGAHSSASSLTTPELSRESSPVVADQRSPNYFPGSPVKHSPVPITPQSATWRENTFKNNAWGEVPSSMFKDNVFAAPATTELASDSTSTPNVPQRAEAHTKQTHQALARKRSVALNEPAPSGSGAGASTNSLAPAPLAPVKVPSTGPTFANVRKPSMAPESPVLGSRRPSVAPGSGPMSQPSFRRPSVAPSPLSVPGAGAAVRKPSLATAHLASHRNASVSTPLSPASRGPQQPLPALPTSATSTASALSLTTSSTATSSPAASSAASAHPDRPAFTHPFGAELTQVDELAEEYSVQILDPEAQWLADRGFACCSVDDYAAEISPLWTKLYAAVDALGMPPVEEAASPTSWF